MVSSSSLTSSPNISLGQTRSPTINREDSLTAFREKLQTTQPSGTSVAKTDTSSAKNYNEAQQFADARRTSDASSSQGNRRGSLLDLSV